MIPCSWAYSSAIQERRPLHELHDEGACVHRLLDAVDRRDVGMVERGQEAGLALEARHPLRVAAHVVGKDLEGHLAPEPGIPGAVHLSHPALPERARNLVWTDTCAWAQHPGDTTFLLWSFERDAR
jgi:hypothetical protein